MTSLKDWRGSVVDIYDSPTQGAVLWADTTVWLVFCIFSCVFASFWHIFLIRVVVWLLTATVGFEFLLLARQPRNVHSNLWHEHQVVKVITVETARNGAMTNKPPRVGVRSLRVDCVGIFRTRSAQQEILLSPPYSVGLPHGVTK